MAELHDKENAARLWRVVRRIFSFAEPARKSSQLYRLAMNALPVSQRDDSLGLVAVLSSLFGGVRPTVEDELLSACLFINDASRFCDIAFASSPKHSDRTSNKIKHALANIAREGAMNQAKVSWCLSMIETQIPWSSLLGGEDAVDETLRPWLLEVLKMFSTLKIDDPTEQLRTALAKFDAMVVSNRRKLPSEFLPSAVFLLEGATEMVLLPHVAKCLGVSFDGFGMMVEGAGGANQVARQYARLSKLTVLPLYCLLDADASDQATTIRHQLRENDRLFVISQGEVEDTLDEKLFVDLLNEYLHSALASARAFDLSDLQCEGGKVKAAVRLLRDRASLEFDKVKFARAAVVKIRRSEDVPEELRSIVMSIAEDLSRSARHGR